MSIQTCYGSQIEQPSGRSIIIFFLLAFGISWAGYAPSLMRWSGLALFAHPAWSILLILPGVGPAAAAICVRHLEGVTARDSLEDILHSFTRYVSSRLWLITVAAAFAVPILAAAITRSTMFRHQHLSRPPAPASLLLFGILSLLANPCEEVGWRGFAQRRLQTRFSALTSALIIGGLWATWHIPLFLVMRGPQSMVGIPFWVWAAGVPPQAILLAWLYNRSKHSLATVSLFHLLTNVFASLFVLSWEASTAMRLIAAVCLAIGSGRKLANCST